MQLDLFISPPPPEPLRFDGPVYDPIHDQKRLSTQYYRIFNLMKDGKWRTLEEIEIELKYPQASISAQLRHAKKKRNGSHRLEKQRRGEEKSGLWEYRLTVNENTK